MAGRRLGRGIPATITFVTTAVFEAVSNVSLSAAGNGAAVGSATLSGNVTLAASSNAGTFADATLSVVSNLQATQSGGSTGSATLSLTAFPVPLVASGAGSTSGSATLLVVPLPVSLAVGGLGSTSGSARLSVSLVATMCGPMGGAEVVGSGMRDLGTNCGIVSLETV